MKEYICVLVPSFKKIIEDVINMFYKGIEFKLLVEVPHVENIYFAL